MLTKLISGGQTGADMGALLAAQQYGIETGGWCPPDGMNERGLIPAGFGLIPTPEERSAFGQQIPRSLRSEWNVRDSDGTLIFGDRETWGTGTHFTWDMCELYDKPCLLPDISKPDAVVLWIISHGIYCVNVAGPKESEAPGLQEATYEFLLRVFEKGTKKP